MAKIVSFAPWMAHNERLWTVRKIPPKCLENLKSEAVSGNDFV